MNSEDTLLDYEGLTYYHTWLIAYIKSLSSAESLGVESFNGRKGNVSPQNGDYTASMVGAVPTTRTVNGKALSSNITLTAANVSAVPTTCTVNGKALSSNITLTASDVGAQESGSYVPTTRTVNGKALSSNITLTAANVSAVPTTRTVNGKALSSNITLTASELGIAGGVRPISVVYNGTGASSGSLKISIPSASVSNLNAICMFYIQGTIYDSSLGDGLGYVLGALNWGTDDIKYGTGGAAYVDNPSANTRYAIPVTAAKSSSAISINLTLNPTNYKYINRLGTSYYLCMIGDF